MIELKEKIGRIAPKAIEAFKAEQVAQMERPVFLVQIIAGDMEGDILKVRKDSESAPLLFELKLPATAKELRAAYDFQTKNGICYQTVESIRYPAMINDMAVVDLDLLNEASRVIDQMDETQLVELQPSMRDHTPENEVQLKELCEEIHGPMSLMQHSLKM